MPRVKAHSFTACCGVGRPVGLQLCCMPERGCFPSTLEKGNGSSAASSVADEYILYLANRKFLSTKPDDNLPKCDSVQEWKSDFLCMYVSFVEKFS